MSQHNIKARHWILLIWGEFLAFIQADNSIPNLGMCPSFSGCTSHHFLLLQLFGVAQLQPIFFDVLLLQVVSFRLLVEFSPKNIA